MGNLITTAFVLFAQAEGGGEAGGGAAAPQGPGMLNFFLWMVIPILILYYFLLGRPQRREQSKREQLLKALKPNDRVVTIGGIYGVVTNIHREANQVTIRVDDGTNTKIRVQMGAIGQVLSDEPSGEAQKKENTAK